MIFVDTNYFIRFLLNDIYSQHKTAEELFQNGAKGKVNLFTSVIVIFEIYWVFTTFYKKKKVEVVDILKNILSLKFINFENREIVSEALYLFENSKLELEDCYNITYAKKMNIKDFKTFDKRLEKYLNKYKIKE